MPDEREPTVIVKLRRERESCASGIPEAIERFKSTADAAEAASSTVRSIARRARAESRNRQAIRAMESGETPPVWNEEVTGQFGVVRR